MVSPVKAVGYSGIPLVKQLRLKPSLKLLHVNAPKVYKTTIRKPEREWKNCVIDLNNTKKVYNVIYNVHKLSVWIFNGLLIKEV